MIIFFCSPFAGTDKAMNVHFARQCCTEISATRATPFAPHLVFPTFLDDDVPEERERGIAHGIEVMKVSKEVWCRLPPWRLVPSTGMKHEIANAELFGIKLVVISSQEEWDFHLARLTVLCAR